MPLRSSARARSSADGSASRLLDCIPEAGSRLSDASGPLWRISQPPFAGDERIANALPR